MYFGRVLEGGMCLETGRSAVVQLELLYVIRYNIISTVDVFRLSDRNGTEQNRTERNGLYTLGRVSERTRTRLG